MNLNNNKICRLLVFAMLLMLSWGAAAFAGVPTEVVLNRSIILTLKEPVERVTLANPGVADIVVISPKQIQINGTAIGKTSLVAWMRGSDKPIFYDLTVKGDQATIEEQMKSLAPGDSITVDYANDAVVLSGKVAKDQTKAKAEKIAQAYGAKVLNYIEMADPVQVLLQVKVAQIDKTALKRLGISALVKGHSAEGFSNMVGAPSGGSSISSTSSSGSSSTSGTGIVGNIPGLGGFTPLDTFQLGASYFKGGIGATLQALVTKGHAKILAEPNLLVKSGQEGNFLAGSKIPYSVIQTSGGSTATTIVFQDVGIKLKFKPEVLENGLINLKIDPAEVSSLAGTLAVNGYPIIDTRTVQTNVELRDGESLVMAGLLQEDAIKTMSKIPLLGDIPILGALFRSTQEDIKEKELVFFVTPKIVMPVKSGQESKFVAKPGESYVLPTDVKLTPEQERDLKWMPLGQ